MARMKNFLTAILLCVILALNGAGADGKDKVAVRLGMTKQEVTAILGQPDDISFDYRSEQWEYYINGGLTKYDKRIFVGFDSEGRVVTYRSVSLRPDDRNDDYHMRGTDVGPMRHYFIDEFCMDERAFSVLYDKVKAASFSDNKFDLVEVASLGCYFSCSQCARILSLFSFSSDKFKALQFMAPRISDYQNANVIYSVFDFDSDKARAAEILGGR